MKLSRLLIPIALVLLSACASLRPGPLPSVVHRLPPMIDAAPSKDVVNLQLSVAEPQLLALWQSNRVLLRTEEGELGALQGVVLADETGALLQDSLIEALRLGGGLHGVGRPGDGLRNDWLLLSSVSRFELDYRAQPARAEMIWDLRLLDAASGRELASTRLQGGAQLDDIAEPGSAARARGHASRLLEVMQQQAERAASWVQGLAAQQSAPPSDGFEAD